MKPIILIGRADCWREDFEGVKNLIQDFDVMSVGLDCVYADDIKYFVTYHPQDIVEYIKRRKEVGVTLDFKVISHIRRAGVDIIEEHKAPTGSSSLLGTAAAIRLGYTKIILCGCPLEGTREGNFQPYNHFQEGWKRRRNEIYGYVKSMSGWTKEFLGEPTKEWLIE